MAQYNVQDPQGNMRVIEGPDGASDSEVISQAQKLFGQSGGMAPVSHGLQTIRDAIRPTPTSMAADAVASQIPIPGVKMLLHSAFPPDTIQSPQNAFKQDQQTGNAQDTTVPDLAAAQAVYSAPSAARALTGLADAGMSKIGSLVDYLKTLANAPKAAAAAAPVEDALTLGNTAKAGVESQASELKGVNDAIYSHIPQDFRASTPGVEKVAQDTLSTLDTLPPSFQSDRIKAIAKDLSNLSSESGTPFGTIHNIRSQLAKIAYSGDTDAPAAAKLLKALQGDIDNISNSAASLSNVPSQQPSLEAQRLRQMWAEVAKGSQQGGIDEATAQGHFINPESVGAAPGQLTNSDIPQTLKEANALYAQRMDLANHPVTRALGNARPEEMYKTAFGRGNVSDVNVAKQALGPVGFQAVQGQFFDQLKGAKDIGAKLGKYSPEFLNAALGPQKVQILQNLHQFNTLVAKAKFALGLGLGAAGAGGAYKVGQKLF